MQSLAGIYSVAQGYEPFIQGVGHTPRYGFEGAPFLGQMGMGAMLAHPFLMRAMGGMNMTPMGVGHDQNVYDTIKNQQFTQAQQQAMADAAQSDRMRFLQTFRGMAAMTGTPWGAEQRRAAGSLADAASFAAPIMAHMAPDMLDQMAGLRGSATVMTRRMMEATRFRADPVTGRIGMSGESAGQMARGIYDDLYAGQNFRQMQGVTAGQLGSMFEQLQHRGLIEGPGVSRRALAQSTIESMARDRPDIYESSVRRLVERGPDRGGLKAAPADATKLSADELDKLTLDPSVADRLRSFDAEKIKRSLKSYVGAVGAMRDIFGDMGRPDAPMRELVSALEALTGGSVGRMDPQRLGLMARQTYNLAKQTGATMDSVMTLQQHAAARGQQLGLEPVFAVGATQGALGFGGAYRSMGHAAHTAWGAMNADQITQADANLRMQASASVMANRLGAVMRLSQTTGGFREGTDAQRMVEAISAGRTEYRDAAGSVRSLHMNDQQFFNVLQGASDRGGRRLGMSESMIRDIVDQRDTNREFVERFGVTDIVRRTQGQAEVQPFIADRLKETLSARLGEIGMDRRQATADVSTIAGKATGRIFGMATSDFSDNTRRTAGIARILEEELEGTTTGAQLQKMTSSDRENFFRLAGGQFMGNANRAIRQSGFAGLESMQNVHRLFNTETMGEASKQQEQARFTARMQEAMSPLGRGTALQRSMQFLQDVRPGDTDKVQNLIAQAFGGVKREDISKAIMQPLEELHQRRAKLEDLRRQVGESTDSTEKTRLQTQVDEEMESLGQQSAQLAKVGEQHGYFRDSGISRDEARRVVRQSERVLDAHQDMASIRGGFGTRVFRKDIEKAQQEWNSGTPATEFEAKAVILARRKKTMRDVAAGKSGVSGHHIREAKRIVKETTGRDISDTEAMQTALGMLQTNLYDATPAEIEQVRMDTSASNRIQTVEEAEALVLARRQQTALRADDTQVDAVRKQYTNLNDAQARLLADSRQRAKRFGIGEEEIKGYMRVHDDPILRDSNKKPMRVAALDEYGAIDKAMRVRDATQWVVTASDIERFKTDNAPFRNRFTGEMGTDGNYGGIDEEKKRQEAERNRQEIAGQVLRRRQQEKVERFGRFFQSEDGARFREDIDMQSQDIENVIAKLVQGPEMTRRMGSRAIDIHQRLRATEERKRNLASFHTRGDVARLVAGQIGVDESTTEGRETSARIRAEVDALQAEQLRLLREVESPTSQTRPVRVGDATAAKSAFADNVGDFVKGRTSQDMTMRDLAAKHAAWQRSGSRADETFVDPRTGRRVTYTQAEYEQFNRGYTPYEQQARERQGDREMARERMGFRPDQSLTAAQKRDVGQLANTITTDRERSETGGRSYRLGSEADAYEHFVANIGQYVTGDKDKDLLSIATARQAWHAAGRPKESAFTRNGRSYTFTQEDHERMRAAFGSRYQESAQEKVGNIQEAMAVLGFSGRAYEDLNASDKKKVDEMAFSAGIARRVRSEDEEKLDVFMRKDTALTDMARRHGTSVREMMRVLIPGQFMGEKINFSAEQKQRIGEARGDYVKAAGVRQDVERRLAAAQEERSSEKDVSKHAGIDRRIGELRGEYDKALVAERKSTGGIEDIRRAFGGLTNEEIFSGKIQKDIQLTPEESSKREGLNKDIGVAKAKQVEIQGKIDKAMQDLGTLADPAILTDPTRAAQAQVKRDNLLGQIDDLTKQQDAAKAQETGAVRKAQTLAAGAGLSSVELLDKERSSEKLTVLTGDQKTRLLEAQRAYGQASDRSISENERVRQAQRGLSLLVGKTDDASNSSRKQYHQVLHEATRRREAARGDMRKAEDIVGDDAKRRGVSVGEYLKEGRGRLSEGAIGYFVEEMARQGSEAPQIMKMIERMGLTRPEDAARYKDFVEALTKRQKEAAAVENVPGMELIKQANQAFGLGLDDSTLSSDKDAGRLAPSLNTTEGRRIIQQAIGTRRSLQETATAGAGIFSERAARLAGPGATDDEKAKAARLRQKAADMRAGPQGAVRALTDDWIDVEKKRRAINVAASDRERDDAQKAYAGAVRQFRSDYDLDDTGKFGRFKDAMEFQNRSKFLDFALKTDKKFTAADLANRVDTMLKGDTEGKGGERGMPENMHITGDLILRGDGRASMDCLTGADYRHSAIAK